MEILSGISEFQMDSTVFELKMLFSSYLGAKNQWPHELCGNIFSIEVIFGLSGTDSLQVLGPTIFKGAL